ncbi:molecular chaperone DnaJ [Acidihalobacter aeolianus]|uniref:Molecular chaperone DnaJ n=1 Tax=Acidihalobacter aeolianus TaxID=2792603 RepID=A0A1D8K438_9GAMM|nr:DnaJ domain-containing protein [Acidihalobacter aeolianus]AOV15718.1 molecular chaperone DnaJ [Acidihalobacter aeolianus]
MSDALDFDDEELWVIWNGEQGLVTTSTIGEVESGAEGRQAWLEEPFDMVGPFSLDELLTKGRIAFAACVVMSRQRWQADQVELRRESLRLRRAAQERMEEEFARYNQRRNARQDNLFDLADERRHREALNLPAEGRLEATQIKKAFRRLAQKAHPDSGGSHEQFLRITQARNALLECAS